MNCELFGFLDGVDQYLIIVALPRLHLNLVPRSTIFATGALRFTLIPLSLERMLPDLPLLDRNLILLILYATINMSLLCDRIIGHGSYFYLCRDHMGYFLPNTFNHFLIMTTLKFL